MNMSPTTNTMQVGKPAPDFRAMAYVAGSFKEVSLKDFSGKWVCLFFYPLDFTFVCPTEIKSFAQHEAQFKEQGCEVIGASTDSHHTHKAWFERDLKDVKFPVLADTNHSVSKAYNVLLEDKGFSLRGTFLIDPKGILQWATVNALDVGRSVEEVLRTLQALKTGGLCPADWKAGQPNLKG
jgi:alkyl hydroperoxide reductase subunit AhpC